MNRRVFLISGLACLASTAPLLGKESKLVGTGSKLTPDEVTEFLKLHNLARKDVGVPALTWSPKLAAVAQKWADTLSASGKFEHSGGIYGENLAGGYDVTQAVTLWLNEKADFEAGKGFAAMGHYSQVVWRDSKRVGCGKAKGPSYDIYVANYDPPGNMAGEKPY